jgi:outer membrane lipoprotein SlyB
MKRIAGLFITLAAALVLTACAAPGGAQPGAVEIRRGVIEQISSVQIPTNHHQGVGAIVGGLGGLGIGSLIGAGTGRDVAMAVGAIGGAVVGNEVQKKHDQPIAGQQIIVRLSSGDIGVVLHAADRLNASAVMIEDHTAFRTDWMPFAGRRESGYGVGGIPFSMREMTQEKMRVFRYGA